MINTIKIWKGQVSSLTHVSMFSFILYCKGNAPWRPVRCLMHCFLCSDSSTPTHCPPGECCGEQSPGQGTCSVSGWGAVSTSAGCIYICLFGITIPQSARLIVHSHECKNDPLSSAIRLQNQWIIGKGEIHTGNIAWSVSPGQNWHYSSTRCR